MTRNDVGRFWEWFERARGELSVRQIERQAGCPRGRIGNVYSTKAKPSEMVCQSIARALHEPPEKVLRLAGLLPPLPSVEDKSYGELVELAKELTIQERREVYDLMLWKYQSRRRSGGSLLPRDKGIDTPNNVEDVQGATKDSK